MRPSTKSTPVVGPLGQGHGSSPWVRTRSPVKSGGQSVICALSVAQFLGGQDRVGVGVEAQIPR
jgi:hypothetical protein